jgi:cytosine/adenosine deaminase-related metal-dependent hydrolase
VTINAARQIGQGDRLGSLEKGKEADFTILESDPYKVSPDAIADARSGTATMSCSKGLSTRRSPIASARVMASLWLFD